MENFKREWRYLDGRGSATTSDKDKIWFGFWEAIEGISEWAIVQFNDRNQVVAKWKPKR